ncbi:MAG: RNA polymerase sigma-I factor [Anaerovorax sp.]|nr:RNA polymerase sigma-I factor [Anaerovorax sp.]
MNDLKSLVRKAAVDNLKMEELIKRYESFILRCASSATHRYITKNDDEWSIALLAFSQAVHDYNAEKGAFLSFAELVIRRRMVDFLRSEMRYKSEIPIEPTLFHSEPSENASSLALHIEVTKKTIKSDQIDLKLEIETTSEIFSSYGFTFFELTDCSPKAEKTKKACAKAVCYVLKNELLLHNLRKSKLLPIKIIEKNAKVPRKILERHRKYIIAAVEILSGEYPGLADYMRFIREEMDK